MVKNYIFLGVFSFISWLFWLFTSFWLNSPSLFSNAGVFTKPLVFLIFSVSLLSLAFLLIEDKNMKFWFSAALFGPFLLVFGYDNLYLGAFALAFSAQLLAIRRFNSEKEGRLKFNVGLIMKRGTPFVITSFLILISFGYFLTPRVQMSDENQKISGYLENIVRVASDNVLKNRNGIDQQARSQAESELLFRLDSILSPYKNFLPPILAIGFFLILQGFSFVFLWLAIAFSAFLFWIFKKSGIIKIETIKKESEVVKFSYD